MTAVKHAFTELPTIDIRDLAGDDLARRQAVADASGPSLSFLPPAAAQAATVGGASNSRVSPLRVIGHPTFPSSQ